MGLLLPLLFLCTTAGPSGVQFRVMYAKPDGSTGRTDRAAAAIVVPKSQGLRFRVDQTDRMLEVVQGEPITDVLARACTTMNICDPRQQQVVRWNILYNKEATGTTAHTFLINRCGMHADQNPRTGEFAKSNVASFLAPLFFPEAAATAASSPQQAGRNKRGRNKRSRNTRGRNKRGRNKWDRKIFTSPSSKKTGSAWSSKHVACGSLACRCCRRCAFLHETGLRNDQTWSSAPGRSSGGTRCLLPKSAVCPKCMRSNAIPGLRTKICLAS